MGKILFKRHENMIDGKGYSAETNISSDWVSTGNGSWRALVDNAVITSCKGEKCSFKKDSKIKIKIESRDEIYIEFDDYDLISVKKPLD